MEMRIITENVSRAELQKMADVSLNHPSLASGRWTTFSLMEQLGHVGSEVDRAIHWSKKGDQTSARLATIRALELLDLTLNDERWQGRKKEIARAREVLCDRFFGENTYHTEDDGLKKYFLGFGMAAALQRSTHTATEVLTSR